MIIYINSMDAEIKNKSDKYLISKYLDKQKYLENIVFNFIDDTFKIKINDETQREIFYGFCDGFIGNIYEYSSSKLTNIKKDENGLVKDFDVIINNIYNVLSKNEIYQDLINKQKFFYENNDIDNTNNQNEDDENDCDNFIYQKLYLNEHILLKLELMKTLKKVLKAQIDLNSCDNNILKTQIINVNHFIKELNESELIEENNDCIKNLSELINNNEVLLSVITRIKREVEYSRNLLVFAPMESIVTSISPEVLFKNVSIESNQTNVEIIQSNLQIIKINK